MSLAIRNDPDARTRQPPLHCLGAFGEAERDRGLLVEPCDCRSGDQPRLAKIFGADAHPLDRIAPGEIVPLADRHGDVDRSGLALLTLMSFCSERDSGWSTSARRSVCARFST